MVTKKDYTGKNTIEYSTNLILEYQMPSLPDNASIGAVMEVEENRKGY